MINKILIYSVILLSFSLSAKESDVDKKDIKRTPASIDNSRGKNVNQDNEKLDPNVVYEKLYPDFKNKVKDVNSIIRPNFH